MLRLIIDISRFLHDGMNPILCFFFPGTILLLVGMFGPESWFVRLVRICDATSPRSSGDVAYHA